MIVVIATSLSVLYREINSVKSEVISEKSLAAQCGEDEYEYAEYDWYGSAWVSKNTGSKNQCYPLYASIKCGN